MFALLAPLRVDSFVASPAHQAVGPDRFAGLASWRGGRIGRVITRPVEVTAPGLEINVEWFELNPIRVAVSTAEGTMLPGDGFDECRADCSARRIYTPVRWQSKPDLSELREKKVKTHFEIQGAALDAYHFVPPPVR